MPSIPQIIRRRHNRKQRRRVTDTRSRLWGIGIALALSLLVLLPVGGVMGLSLVLYGQAAAYMVTPQKTIYTDPIVGTTELYDRSGQTLLFGVSDPLGNDRQILSLADLPPTIVQATLRMEDSQFLQTSHFRLAETINALWNYMLGGITPRDASLTARLVRSTLLPHTRGSGLDDTLLQLVLTAEVNRRYTPEEVLEWYLNTAYYGRDAYGIEAAAQIYLNKSARDLTWDEAALLAAVPSAPQFNPFTDETAARGRQADLLRVLLNTGAMTQLEYDTAIASVTPLRHDFAQTPRIAPDFSLYARAQAEDILNNLGQDGARLVSRGGLRITTSLDLDMYYQGDCLLRAHLAQLNGQSPENTVTVTGEPCKALPYLLTTRAGDRSSLPDSGSLLLLNPETGEILALVGNVTATDKAPGATLYPFVYLQGFLSGSYTPASMVLDIPQSFPGAADGLIYSPQNIDGQYRGPLNLRDAFVSGLRAPAVSVADTQGLNRVLYIAHKLGLNSLDETSTDLSLLENGGAVSVLDMTYAYSLFAAQGTMVGVDTPPLARNYRTRNPVAVLKIEDADGNVLWEYDDNAKALSRTNILESDLAYLIGDILNDAGRRRAVWNVDDTPLRIGRYAPVMTTFTKDHVSDWAVGYTPQRVLGVQMGQTSGGALSLDPLGLQGAAPVWNALMRYSLERDSLPAITPQRSENIVEYLVCEKSGLIPPPQGSECPTRKELFLQKSPPYQQDIYWQSIEVNSQNGLLATPFTPSNLVLKKVFFVPPDAALDWWRSNNLPLPPKEHDLQSRPQVLRAVNILLPESFATVSGVVDIRGSIELPKIQTYQVSYGQGLNPAQWFTIGERQTSYQPGTSLGQWDTKGLSGIYTLQLSVMLPDNTLDTDFVQVTVDNEPPTVDLQAGEPGQIFRTTDVTIPIVANVTDQLSVQRVEFYRNGTLIGTDEEWPFNFNFTIERAGTEVFRATAFDQAGNQASAEVSVEIVRGGG
jgi:membrane peptidoglycan carboxypeptidase